MNTMDWSRVFKYAAIALVVILFLVLSSWYIYLRNETSTIEGAAEGRGFSEGTPLPSSSLGSMFGNIAGFRNSDDPVSGETLVVESDVGLSGTIRSFISRLFGRQSQSREGGVSNFSSTVKNAFSDLVSGLVPENEAPVPPRPPRLWHAQKTPISGFGFLENASTTLRFMERSTGHLFDINPETGTVRRITNTLIPKAYEASFANDGSVIARVMDGETAVVFFGIVGTSATGTPATLALTDLGESVIEIIPSRTAREFIALIPEADGFALIQSGWRGEKPRRLAETTLQGWRLHSTREKVIMSQDPASTIPGYAYVVGTNGTLSPLARGIPGLTILPHDSSDALLIGSDNGSVFLSARTATSSKALPIRTIADKCVWAPSSKKATEGKPGSLIAYCAVPESIASTRFIDEWYRGTYHTEDSWWKVDAGAGTAELLISPRSEMSISLDVSSPKIDDGGNYLAFMNRLDQSLWVLRISDQ